MTTHDNDPAARAAALVAAMPAEIQALAIAALERLSDRHPNTGAYGWLMGIHYDSAEPGKVACSMEVNSSVYNPGGMAHGGVMFGLVDSAMGGAVYTLLDRTLEGCVTAELKLNYLRPVRAGVITATATVLQRGRTLAVVTADVRNERGELLGVAQGTFAITQRKQVE